MTRTIIVIAAVVLLVGVTPGFARVHAAEPETSGAERIKRIKLKGCKQVACRTVRNILAQEPTPWWRLKVKEGGYDPFWAKEDQRRIGLFYRGQGFYSAEVSEPEVKEGRLGVTITYRIVEHDPVKVSKIDVEWADGYHEDNDPEKVAKLIGFKQGDRFEQGAYQKAQTAIANYYKDEAFYRVAVERNAEVDPAALTAVVHYRIVKGERYRIRSIDVAGCEQTDESVVRRALTIETKKRWEQHEVLEDQRRVQSLPIYQTVRMEEKVDDEAHRIDMTVRVVEAEPQMIKLGVGYGSEEYWRFQAYWRHLNFLGGARQLSATARWSMLLEREELSFIQPNLGRPGDFLQVAAKREVQNEDTYSYEALSISPTYHLILTHYLWSEVSYHLESNRLFNVAEISGLDKEDLSRQGLLSAVSGRLEWADVDDPFRTTKGARASLYVEYGGGPIGGDFPYVKAIGEARGYWPFGPVVGALKWKLGYAEPFGNLTTIPLFKRFYAGGTGSVRGFARRGLGPLDNDGDPLGGAKLWESNLEFRFPIYEEISGVAFLDSGWVWLEDQNYDPNDLIYSAGFGIRYDTAIGPIAFDVGFPLTGYYEYQRTVFHFNIGQTF